MTGMFSRFLVLFIATVGLIIGSADAGNAQTNFGRCTLAKDQSTSPDGTCGKWKVDNDNSIPSPRFNFACPMDVPKANPTEKPNIIIDFRCVSKDDPNGSGPEKPLTIIRVCVLKRHDVRRDDQVVVATSGSRDPKSNKTWTLEVNDDGCHYLPLRPGMILTVSLTNPGSELTASGRSASGTWAIVK